MSGVEMEMEDLGAELKQQQWEWYYREKKVEQSSGCYKFVMC